MDVQNLASSPDPLSRLVLDTVTDLVVLLHVVDGSSTIATVSSSWTRAVGGTADGWLGRPASEALPARSGRRIAELVARGGIAVFDDSLGDDGAHPVEVTATTTELGGERYVLWVARDVGDQRRQEAVMRSANDDLQRSNSDLAEFALVASHDLKEPLRMVTAYLELLEERHGDALDERGAQYLGFARDGASRLRGLIESLLEYAKIRTSPVAVGPVDLAAVVDAVRHELAPAITERHAAVTTGELGEVVASAPLLQAVLQNLVANAVKFNDGGATVHVECRSEDDGWLITVDDDGIGIPDERRDDVFAMFRRLNPRARFAGSGMGLALCRSIAEAHGGDIWFADSPLGGIRACLQLPFPHPTEDLP